MMHLEIIKAPLLSLAVLLWGMQVEAQAQKGKLPASDYRAPQFTDVGRSKKIKAIFPLVERLYKNYAKQNSLPSIVFGLVVDGSLVFSGGYGFADIEKKTPATTTSAFRIASMTKSFTAMAIIKLRDEGKLRLDDPAHLFIPEMKKLKPLTDDAPVITIRHLLTHAAGFPQDDPWADRQLADTDKELLELIDNGLSFSNVPGVAYEYSNVGYAMLGRIITIASGKPFDEYINQKILEPLGMNSSYWEYNNVPTSQLAQGYRRMNNSFKPETLLHHGIFGAMGGMITTIEDFCKYMALHLQAWPARNEDDTKVLRNSSVREMHHPWNFAALNAQYRYPGGRACATATAYAYGLRWTKDCAARVSVGHSGGLPGFGSNWMILPDYGIGVVCFSNITYAPISVINTMVLDTVIAVTGIKPRTLPPSNILQQRKADLLKLLPGWSNAERTGVFAENFFLDNPIEGLRKDAARIFAAAGKILKVGELLPQNQLRGTFILYGERKNIEVFFTLTPQSIPLIQAFDLKEVSR